MATRDEIALYALTPPGERPGLAGFDLLRLDGQTMGLPETGSPHRHDYHEIIIVEDGTVLHTVDGQPSTLGPGNVALTGQGRIHLMLQMTNLRGWVIRFGAELLLVAPGSDEARALAQLVSPVALSPALTVGAAELAHLDVLCRIMQDELDHPGGEASAAVVRHALLTALLRLARLAGAAAQPDERMATPEYRVYQEFLLALEQDFRTHHDVGHYAAALGLSPPRLARVISQAVGKAPKQLIGERLALEGKRLLTYTALSVKEVTHALGYHDQFHFSRAFKAQTGVPPQAIREQ